MFHYAGWKMTWVSSGPGAVVEVLKVLPEQIARSFRSMGVPVPPDTEEIIDGVRGVPVPQIREADSVVLQITEDGADVVQVMLQERVQNRTQQQIVGVPVRDKIAIWEKIVEETQPVLSKRMREREILREHPWCKDFADVPVPSRPDHTGDALIPHIKFIDRGFVQLLVVHVEGQDVWRCFRCSSARMWTSL